MIFTAQLVINGEHLVDLFDLNVKKSEISFIQDALNCELRYGLLNF